MKTRTLVFICISLVVAAVILMSGSCDNGAVEIAYFMYDGTKYQMDESTLTDEGATNGSYYFHFLAWGARADSDSGDVLEIGFWSPTSTLAEGTYTILYSDSDPHWEDPYYSGGRIMINVTEGPGGDPVGDALLEFDSGTITINSFDSTNIDLEFDAILEDSKPCTGMYNGPYTL